MADTDSLDRPDLDRIERRIGAGDVPALISYARSLESQLAMVRNFINEREQFITAARNAPAGSEDDYWRWNGHAEARHVLSERLGSTQ